MVSFQHGNFLVILGEIYLVILFVRVILSWFPYDPSSPINGVRRVIWSVTEPVLAPVRRLMPPVGGLDLSVLVVMIVLQILISQVFADIHI